MREETMKFLRVLAIALAAGVAYLMMPTFGYTAYFLTIPVALTFGVFMDRHYDTLRPYMRMKNNGGTNR